MTHRVLDNLQQNPDAIFDLLRELVGGHGQEAQVLVRLRDADGDLPTLIFGVEPADYEEDDE